MVLFTQDAWVWLEHGEDAYIPVKMIVQKGDKILAKASTNEQYELDISKEYREVHPSSLKPVENMVAMEELSEAAILHNLRLRFEENLIYTHISSILVSINPFKQLAIYSPSIMREYSEKMARMEACAPHVYYLADTVFRNLRQDNENQSVIISGESGAGKTEATKLVLQYLANANSLVASTSGSTPVEQQLLSSNPIIEAFGNAKTVRNNNSSRFGKLIEIKFNERFHIVGADIKNYLLEKSRIVVPGQGERNYHLFYQICAGATAAEKEKWCLDHAGKFKILSIGGCLEVEGTDDVDEYKQLRNAMDILDFNPTEVDDIMRTTSACLHLGNIEFTSGSKDDAILKNMEVLEVAARLLKVDVKALHTSLVSQRKQMGRESILTVRSQMLAESSRDALVKKIYSTQFDAIIDKIRKVLSAKTAGSSRIVGVLDIFGFEIFQTNRFEQLCINFANEKMQRHFNAYVFEMEQKEYAVEKVDVAHVSYVDNQPCLDLIENGKTSILGMADEELKLPGGGDDNLLNRMHQAHHANKYYTKPKTAVPMFTINHYAGPVEYVIDGFNDKNRDSLESNIAEVIQASQSPFVAALIPSGASVVTLGSQFKAQLVALMETLNSTTPHFIRCIKSNNLKVADTFDSQMVLRQLRYLGLKEVVNIRQLGYPIRRTHQDFARRYGLLQINKAAGPVDFKAFSTSLLQNMASANEKDWRVGVTKVFLRQGLSTMLESAREQRLTKIAIKLQSLGRTKIWRKRFLKVKGAIDTLKRVMDDPNSTPEVLDSAISAYEGLKFKTDVNLIQKALKIRNRLFEQRQAKIAVESALKSMDVDTMRTCITVAEKALLDDSFEPFKRLKALYQQLSEVKKDLETAIASKSLPELKAALEKAKSLNVDTPDVKKAQLLHNQLEEEARAAAKLAEEQRQREIEGLKKAIQIALSNKSGAMLDAAIKKALEAKLGLENDPLILEAQKAVVTLEKEVKVFQLAQELKAAIDSDDLAILEQTVALAMEKGFQNHALTIQAKELIENLKKKKDLLSTLVTAMNSKNEMAIKLVLASLNTPDNLKAVPGLLETPEYKNAQLLMTELAAKKSENAAAAQTAAIQSKQHAVDGLKNAIESRNQPLLEQAIANAKTAGISKDSTDEAGDVFNQAGKLLASIAAENDTRKQELLSANAQVAVETKRNVRRSMIVQGQTNLLAAISAAEKKEANSFDPSVYRAEEFTLEQYPDLRSVNDFADGKKGFKTGMLKHTKDLIPKSLTKFEAQSYAVTASAPPSANASGSGEFPEKFLSDKSIETMKMLQGFMLDRQYSFPDTLVTELFSEILLYPALRNEVYAQLMKQLTNHQENIESYTRGWMLMCILCDAVPPLTNFLNYLLHFIDAHVSSKPEVMAQAASPVHLELAQNYASYALNKLKKTVEKFNFLAPRKDSVELSHAVNQKEAGQPIVCISAFAPLTAVEHIAAFRERTMVPASVRVSLVDGSQISLTVSPWQTNAEVVKLLCEAVAIPDHDNFAIYEMRGMDVQYLYNSDNLLDVQLQWSKQERKEEIKKSKGFFASLFSKKEEKKEDYDEWANNAGMRRFLMKRRIYTKAICEGPVQTDKTTQKNLFYGLQLDVFQGNYPIEEEQAVKLATITKTILDSKVLTPLGPLEKNPPVEDSDVWSHFHLYDVPQHLVKKLDNKKFLSKVEKLQPTLPGQSLEMYLNELKPSPTFGCAFYNVFRNEDPSVPLKLPNELTLAVNYYGLRLIDRKTKQVLDHFPLLNVLGWSSSPIRFVVKVKLNKPIGAGISMVTFKCNTYNPKMGKEICDLLFTYATVMMRAVGL